VKELVKNVIFMNREKIKFDEPELEEAYQKFQKVLSKRKLKKFIRGLSDEELFSLFPIIHEELLRRGGKRRSEKEIRETLKLLQSDEGYKVWEKIGFRPWSL